MKLWISLLLVSGFLFNSSAHALVSPIGVALIPQAELPPADFTITGLRLNLLWGDHHNVYGIDLGTLVNSTSLNSGGIQIAGGLNINHGTTSVVGAQVAGIANLNTNKLTVFGAQAALYNSNLAEGEIVGIQVGVINRNPHTKIAGLEVGLYNEALEVYGFQIGLFNKVDDLHGLQIGLINFNTRGLFAFAPILNIGF